jgi:hypothetical protein
MSPVRTANATQRPRCGRDATHPQATGHARRTTASASSSAHAATWAMWVATATLDVDRTGTQHERRRSHTRSTGGTRWILRVQRCAIGVDPPWLPARGNAIRAVLLGRRASPLVRGARPASAWIRELQAPAGTPYTQADAPRRLALVVWQGNAARQQQNRIFRSSTSAGYCPVPRCTVSKRSRPMANRRTFLGRAVKR